MSFNFPLKSIGIALSWFGKLIIALTVIMVPLIILEAKANNLVVSPMQYFVVSLPFLFLGWIVFKLGKWTDHWIKDNL